MSEFWIELNIAWDCEPCIRLFDESQRLAWIKLLCHVKLWGHSGRCKALTDGQAASLWGLRKKSVARMLVAAVRFGALTVEDGEWVVGNWSAFVRDDIRDRPLREEAHRLQDEAQRFLGGSGE